MLELNKFVSTHESEIEITQLLQTKANRHAAITAQAFKSQGVVRETKPLSEYAEFILNNGTYDEMTEFVKGISSTFRLKDRKIVLM